ncbi:MAG: tRNA (adenosine(37)-N6)-threonylcarbamoyltransferase complex ATPase subunit type 1 TsaE [Bacillota bacterium]|nr:tRNA (adenosine(37)-N6)-threonylcarbamoyltransferase complex ATPase subunit type 1 TsaE [Bacillota bacterium]HHU60853.1 tRNA (adenosine(37)-N6)-threonylcarbamoyltransferase complex ATPase subunit type 1 TsaE [Natronincola sp.]
MFKLNSSSFEQTIEAGVKLGKLLLPGDLLNLNGDLGAGKTLFVKGVGMGLGVEQDFITSPTFAIINEYEGGSHPLYHFDLYRLETELELEQIGYLDYFYGDGITAVEWGNLFEEFLPEERLDITLESMGLDARDITFTGKGKRGKMLEEKMRGLF